MTHNCISLLHTVIPIMPSGDDVFCMVCCAEMLSGGRQCLNRVRFMESPSPSTASHRTLFRKKKVVNSERQIIFFLSRLNCAMNSKYYDNFASRKNEEDPLLVWLHPGMKHTVALTFQLQWLWVACGERKLWHHLTFGRVVFLITYF